MHLKNLTMLGFKSFADKTSLNFQPGVSSIVGPNGCGKSNVSDAIRWVLGEQSAKALRGGEMADVIFNGTDGRKPLGMAEVSLTIGDVDEDQLRAAGVGIDYNEVTVTRRVFRDGGSEYFINKTPCRLKDIQQLIMGTGMGRASYSIMAQGNITQLLSSRPEDRRLVFEEAAGITKFKSQKREALRKLDHTEQNLVRVADLVREVKRQIGSLQRQAGKARRYKQFQNELQHLETQLCRHQYDVIESEISQLNERLETLRGETEQSQAAVVQGEDELAQLRARLAELEHEIGGKQQRGLELKAEAERHENQIQFNEERLRDLDQQNSKALSDITQAEERRHAAEEELATTTERLATSEANLQAHKTTWEQRQQAVRELEAQLRQKQEQLREVQATAFAAAQDLARVRNEITALDLQKQGNVARLEKLSAEKVQLEEERTRLEERLSEFQINVETDRLNANTQRGTVEERQARLKAIHAELEQVGASQDTLLQEQAEVRAQLEVIEKLQADHEGFSAGAVAALKQTESVLGSLADRIRVRDQFVGAIESAMGHHLHLVLTEHPESARQIVRDLRESKQGRASIAPLSLMQSDGTGEAVEPAPKPPVAALNGVPVPAVDLVECEQSVQPLVQRILGMTRVVTDLDAAWAAWNESGRAFHYVTLNGEFLSRHGILTGGFNGATSEESGPGSILGRQNQIRELSERLASLQSRVEEASRAKGALQSEQTALQASLEEARTELRKQEVAIATREGEFKALQNSRGLLAQKIETVVYEVQSLAAQDEEGREKRAALSSQLDTLTTAEKEAQERATSLTANQEELRQKREEAASAVSDAKVAVAAEEQMVSSLRQQQAALQQRLDELSQVLEQRRKDTASFLERRQQALGEIEQSRSSIGRVQHDREQLNTEMAGLVAQRQEQETGIETRDADLRGERSKLERLQEQRSGIEVNLAQDRVTLENLCERVEQKYHVKLEDVRSECINVTFADEGPARVETLSPDEMAAAGLSTDWEAVGKQVEALQKKLDDMGPVNLVAIEEYEETEERYQFLKQQHDDLVQAKEQLLEVLSRINTQTREMFLETFKQIRENFRTMFEEVFGGGRADLRLVDENEVLESGIEIMARPPGKQLQSISLLSGGEQTMTAVALLFSIYQVRPSPFCVLDELDAPLDESNINRFLKVLERFLERSQFIIITHNKRTIGMADVLYGVTMQEHGVSKIVSVKFHKDDAPTTGATPLVPPAEMGDVEVEDDAPHEKDETLEMAGAE